jgi:ribose/xylose/arabinose/galactoside ABC-type transport system permease subunit
MLVGPGIGAVCGLCNGVLVTALRLHPFIVTLGTLSIFRGIANVTTQGATLPYQGSAIPDAFTTNLVQRYFFEPPDGLGGVQLTPLFVMLGVAVVGWFYLWATVAGRETYAVGGNETAARFSGINVGRVKRRVYLISGLTAGIAGTLALGYFGTANADYGRGYELTVIAAAVVGGASLTGGRGTALGAILGALTIRLIENAIFKLHLNQQYSQIIVGASIILAVTIDRLSEYIRKRRLAAAG